MSQESLSDFNWHVFDGKMIFTDFIFTVCVYFCELIALDQLANGTKILPEFDQL